MKYCIGCGRDTQNRCQICSECSKSIKEQERQVSSGRPANKLYRIEEVSREKDVLDDVNRVIRSMTGDD